MNRHKLALLALLLNTLLQGALGFGLFAFGQELVFQGITENPLASLCLRLAAYTNLASALIAAYVLLFRRTDRALIRALLAACAAYHALAGAESLRLTLLAPSPMLAEATRGPALFHPICMLVLLGAWLCIPRAPAKH